MILRSLILWVWSLNMAQKHSIREFVREQKSWWTFTVLNTKGPGANDSSLLILQQQMD